MLQGIPYKAEMSTSIVLCSHGPQHIPADLLLRMRSCMSKTNHGFGRQLPVLQVSDLGLGFKVQVPGLGGIAAKGFEAELALCHYAETPFFTAACTYSGTLAARPT